MNVIVEIIVIVARRLSCIPGDCCMISELLQIVRHEHGLAPQLEHSHFRSELVGDCVTSADRVIGAQCH